MGSLYYYVFDGRSNVVALVDSSGTVADSYGYDPYGKTRTSSGTLTNPYQYASGYKDTTGLYHYGARYYDPNTGHTRRVLVDLQAGSATVTGIPALIIILVILALIVVSAVVVVRAIGRKAKDTFTDSDS